jgi:hypothetical protein
VRGAQVTRATLGAAMGEVRLKKLGVVAIVVVGLSALVQAFSLTQLPLSAMYGLGQSGPGTLVIFIYSLLPVLATLGLGGFLIARRERLAERWFDGTSLEIAVDAVSLLRIGIVLSGIGMIVSTIPQLLLTAVNPLLITLQQRADFGDSGLVTYSFWFNDLPRIVVLLLEIGGGVALVAASRSISVWLWHGKGESAGADGLAPGDAPENLSACPSCGAPFDPSDYAGGLATARCSECKEPLGLGDA